MVFQRPFFYYLTITVWLIMDVTVEAYKSGCGGGYCFVVSDINNITERLDLSAAQRWCQSNGAQLIEIRNKDIQNALITFMSSQGSFNGLNILTNGKRASVNWIRLSGQNIGTGNLDLHDQTLASHAYAYLTSTTYGFEPFASRPNDNKGAFICAGLSYCSSGGVMINGQCYKSFTETLSWYDARNRCLDAEGDLASFDQITSNAGFKALNGSWINASNSYWIGIRRESWTWQNSSSDVKYSAWMTGHPINDDADSVCLCLSTTNWTWIECGCNQLLPFVCISDNISTTPKSTKTTTASTASTTTPSSTSTTRLTSTTPTTIDMSKSTLPVTSVSGGISAPTIPGSVTSNSTSTANDTGSMDQHMGLSRGATIGVGFGVGVGGALVITVLIAAVVLLRKRCPRKKTADAKVRRPHNIAAQNSKVNDHRSDEMENPYAMVVTSSSNNNNTNTNTEENFSQSTSAVYASLDFRKEPQSHCDRNVIIVPGKTKPSPGPKPRATNA